jgi:RHS repeat-associated protein
MTYPSGREIIYNYSNHQVISVLKDAASLATNIQYKPFGGISSLTYGNGIVGATGYDNRYRVTSISAGPVMDLTYSQYNANGNITAVNNALDPTRDKSFGYDALDRLTSAASSGIWGSLTWTYDGAGNRLTENGNPYNYFTGSNKLSSANGLSYSFDSNGNTTAEGSRQYVYDQNQRLVLVTDASNTKREYKYNGHGQRVKKVVYTQRGKKVENEVTTIFHYNLAGQLIGESDETGAMIAEYVYLNNQPLAKIEGASTYFYVNDHLATPQKMMDVAGTVVWSADYKPFGEANVNVSTITNNLRFPGQYFDAETGLHYNYFRDYNPVIGRYIEADPIGLTGGINLFAYVQNNPINFVDPLGLEILVCNRKVDGFPFVGNHAYAWDTTTNTAEGMRGSSGSGAGSNEKGPGPDGDSCDEVKGSKGKEKDIMDFMRANQNNGMWFPFVNDCHNAVQDAVENSGLTYPGAPGGRLGAR